MNSGNKIEFSPNLPRPNLPHHVTMATNSSFSYCGIHGGFTPIWRNNGLSQCFYDTIISGILVLLLLPLFYQINKMRKSGVAVESKYKPRSMMYKLQVLCMLLLFIEVPVSFGVTWGVVDHVTSGMAILTLVARSGAVLAGCWLLHLERNMMLLALGKKGHSGIMIFLWGYLLSTEVLRTTSWNSEEWWFQQQTPQQQILFGFWVGRLVCSSLLFTIGFWSPGVPKLNYWLHLSEDDRDVENGSEHLNRPRGEFSGLGSHGDRSTWSGLKEKAVLLWPYMWPSGNFFLQVRVMMCVVILVAGRVVNPYVPIYYKNIVNGLTTNQPWSYVWVQVCAYVGLKFLQGSGMSGGLLNGLRSYLWIRVQQYTNRLVQVRLFSHLHSLSLRWHLSRKTGEVLRSIDRGTISINNLLSYIVFNIIPTICDIMIAIVYFITAFNAWFGLIVFICLALYLVATIIITEWRTKFRRDMNTKDNKAKQRAIDSLLNFETVKYYNAEDHEVRTFDEAIKDYQESEYLTNTSLVFLNLSQNTIINAGLFVGSMLCARYVLDDKFQIGDFVLFGTYIVQLYTPLGFFGTYYRMIQTSFIDMENMFDLFKEGEEISDEEDSIVLQLKTGKVEFDNVCFSYTPEKQILKNISFTVNPGETYALVGSSGSGKSTIIRLLFRFYDIQSGVIRLDNVDISTVTQQSLRACIGVVPQDTVLFNDNIMNNIRYGRISARDEEVEEAAQASDIHHRILAMPDKYETMVGERGLKLSGGEKQRVAIARTLLKAPDIVLLDEATSALDTTTERNIQASLSRVCAGRTSIVVAHRLSTIVNADCILVVNEGEIIERGSHDELLDIGGIYNEMWQQQLTETSDAKENGKTK
ncbi:ATP-binding cassette sub-family B member 6 [Ciona intestinalis]